MARRIQYTPGEKIGPYGFVFVRDSKDSNKGNRKAYFKCPVCGESSEFVICNIKMGKTSKCRKCRGKEIGRNQSLIFQPGDYLDKNKKFIFVADSSEKIRDKRAVWVKNIENGEIFLAELNSIRTGNIQHSPKERKMFKSAVMKELRENGIIKSNARLFPGDIINDNILFVEEIDRTDLEKRRGVFYNIQNKRYFEANLRSVVAGNSQGIIGHSKGEEKIERILQEQQFVYEKEKTFSDLVSPKGHKLRFDFYLPDYNSCIEYDGIQHFENSFGKTDSEYQYYLQCDALKNLYCKNSNIKLIRIKYSDLELIDCNYLNSLLGIER